MNNEENLLQFAIDNGMVDIEEIKRQIAMKERNKILALHDKSVWLGTDNRWRTRVDGKLIAKKSREELDNFLVQYYKDKIERKTFESVFNEWVEQRWQQGSIRKQTLDRYKIDYRRFFGRMDSEYCKLFMTCNFELITDFMVEDFVHRTVHDLNLTSKSWSNMRTLLLGTFGYGFNHRYTLMDINAALAPNRIQFGRNEFKSQYKTKDTQIFNPAEEQRLINYVYNEDYSIRTLGILLAFQTGVRVGELCALKFCDVHDDTLWIRRMEETYLDEDGHQVYRIREMDVKTKAGLREVILTDKALDTIKRIKRLNPFGEYMFMELQDGQLTRIRGKLFTPKLRRICNALQITAKSMHKARKTYGSKLYARIQDKELVREQMGHTDIRTTEKSYVFNIHTDAETKNLVKAAMS